MEDRIQTLVQKWTLKAMSPVTSDAESAVYHECAKELHDMVHYMKMEEAEKAKE